MSTAAPDFLFYSDQKPAPTGWSETLSAIEDPENSRALLPRLVSFATEFSLSGNIWQQWLTSILMLHENPFSLTCERHALASDATLPSLADTDLEIFRRLFFMDFPGIGAMASMTAYHPPYEFGQNHSGRAIAELSRKLAAAENQAKFSALVTEYYRSYGVGIYGLYKAFRAVESHNGVRIVPITDDADVSFDDLIGLETQKKTLRDNTEAFLAGKRANNVLLYGDSGTGKSTSVHALMHDYFDQGLRLIELTKHERKFLPQVLSAIKKRNYHFIIFLDDLSFEENESDYKELKAMLEGALEKRSDRVLIYATSNRRHLIRETWTDRNDMEYQNDIHRSDTMEEKLSLASRFGVTIFYAKPEQKEYQRIVHELAGRSGIGLDGKELDDLARKWELRHGGRSGRTASQLITWLQGEKNEL